MVNAQLKRLHTYPFIKPHDTKELIKYSHFASSCLNVRSDYGYESDLRSESVFNNVVMKLSIELKAKLMTYLQGFNPSFKTTRFSMLGWRILLKFKSTWKYRSDPQQRETILFQKQKNRSLRDSRQKVRRGQIKSRANTPWKTASTKNGIAINSRKCG